MITPAFALTATERVLPKLALDFTTAVLDSRVTFTRTTGASNPATYVNSNGVITAATDNQPRFDYDPITLACKGLLIEESRANSLTYSDDFNNAAWTKSNSTVSTDVTTAPDGTSNADKFIPNSGQTAAYVGRQFSATSGTAYTLTFFAKTSDQSIINLVSNATGSYLSCRFDLNSKTATTVAGWTTSIQSFANGWCRCIATITAAATTSYWYQITNNGSFWTGDGVKGVFIWGAQLETGAFATSYIPTTSVALTRNADVAVMTGANFSNWYNAGTGAFNCAVLPKSATGTKPVLQFDDVTALNTIAMQGNATAVELKITTLAVLQSTLSTGTITANTAYGSCGAWTAGSNALSKSGGAATTGSPVSIPTVTQFRLGSDGTNYFNGWLQKINYWPQRLTNSEVQAFSK